MLSRKVSFDVLELDRVAVFTLVSAGFIGPALSTWFRTLEKLADKPIFKNITKTKYGKSIVMLAIDQSVAAPVINSGFFILYNIASALLIGKQRNLGLVIETAFRAWKSSIIPLLMVSFILVLHGSYRQPIRQITAFGPSRTSSISLLSP